MTTYFPSSNNGRDALPILYLREPVPGSYSEGIMLPGNVMMSMNYATSFGSYSDALAGDSQQQASCIDISSVGVSGSNPLQLEILPTLGGSQVVEHDFSSRGDNRNEMLLMQHPMNVQGGQNLPGQGLSLSLGTEIPSGIQMPSLQYRNPSPSFSALLSEQMKNAEHMPQPAFPGSNSESMKPDISLCGMPSIGRTIQNSKYLKAALELLDEVVNVRNVLKDQESRKVSVKYSKGKGGGSKNGSSVPPANEESLNSQANIHSSSNELSESEKQELQNKVAKLLSMLDEVDTRYRQYYHQMQVVVSSFDAIAGSGAAKPYTALALQTISRHFRCLRDTINGQIRETRGSLVVQDASEKNKGIAISRLRYVDKQLRQRQALQQLGVMQQHAWRPQRGLPESSVSILRAWLFEHFLNPYPTDSEKMVLARQAGLTKSQVSNWFINARVRLWKPMVEDMYKEEIDDIEMNSNSSSDMADNNTRSDLKASKQRGEDRKQSASSIATEQCRSGQRFESKNVPNTEISTDSRFENVTHVGTGTNYSTAKLREDQGPVVDVHSLLPDNVVQRNGDNDRLMAAATAAYNMSELERFGSPSGVSLTLGLQHCEGGSLPLSVEDHHSYVSMRGDEVYNTAVSGHETAGFDHIESEDQQHRFGSSYLLHDFVA